MLYPITKFDRRRGNRFIPWIDGLLVHAIPACSARKNCYTLGKGAQEVRTWIANEAEVRAELKGVFLCPGNIIDKLCPGSGKTRLRVTAKLELLEVLSSFKPRKKLNG